MAEKISLEGGLTKVVQRVWNEVVEPANAENVIIHSLEDPELYELKPLNEKGLGELVGELSFSFDQVEGSVEDCDIINTPYQPGLLAFNVVADEGNRRYNMNVTSMRTISNIKNQLDAGGPVIEIIIDPPDPG